MGTYFVPGKTGKTMWLEAKLSLQDMVISSHHVSGRVYFVLGTLYNLDNLHWAISHGSYRRSDHRMRKAFKHSASGNSSMESTLVGSDLAFRVGPQPFHPAIRLCATYDWLKVSPSGYQELVICLCSGKIPTRGSHRSLSRNVCHAKSASAIRQWGELGRAHRNFVVH